MAKDDSQLIAAKRSYRHAKDEGNRQEEARWANVIGDILKNRGEYVKALKWLRIDYEVSKNYLPEKQLLPTCQSLGELHLRLSFFKDALTFQGFGEGKKHLELAKEADDLIEQQRACTQLGRTYHEMFLSSDDDPEAVKNAKKYFKYAMELAETLKENPPTNKSSFLKEYIDAHNNIGMLEMDLDNLEAAKHILTKGLEICDEEEVIENDDRRSRLHHNLGSVYMELRKWAKAREHIEKDIIICKRIGHCQGEAKGYINLGESHYKVQKYEEASLCYKKALDLAKSMEDEDTLVRQIQQNINTVKEAVKVMDELRKEEQNLKKLSRNIVIAKGTPGERKCLLEQNASLDRLIEKSSMIFAWLKHREFTKKKKRVARELCDKEKLNDAFLAIGESYLKLRNFNKAIKWINKSWEGFKLIGNLEGQALAKTNIGDVLDCEGDWTGALKAFEEGYRIAVEANLPSIQLSALENMHYSYLIRLDDVKKARQLQIKIDKLKESKSTEFGAKKMTVDCCSETDTEGNDHLSDSRSSACSSQKIYTSKSSKSKSFPGVEEDHSSKVPLKSKACQLENNSSRESNEAFSKDMSDTNSNQQTVPCRKRTRIVLSDDEDEMQKELDFSRGGFRGRPVVDIALADGLKSHNEHVYPNIQDISAAASKCATSSLNHVNIDESICSYKSTSPKMVAPNGSKHGSVSNEKLTLSDFAASDSRRHVYDYEGMEHRHTNALLKLDTSDKHKDQVVTFKIDDDLILVGGLCSMGDKFSIDSLKVELACLYYLQLPREKRSKGLLPIIDCMKCGGEALSSLETFESLKDRVGKTIIEVFIDGWVQKRLMQLYINNCEEFSEAPNMKVLKKLYISEVEDEVNVSECELQDISITPLLDALHVHETVAMLDFSHNLLGNGTMEKLKQFFTSSSQKYGDLTLDLHCNRFGSTALFQICECPVLYTRLVALDISGNRLTDACGSYLSTILENCKSLYSLNIQGCSVTSRTIQKIADTLGAGSLLSQLCIGHNRNVPGNAILNLLAKLATLKCFSELDMSGIKLSKPAIDSLSKLAKSSSLSRLMLGSTGIGTDGALQITESLSCLAQESVKLDLSLCGLTSLYVQKLNSDSIPFCSILELNLGGNPFMQEGGDAITKLLKSPQCCLRVLILNKCQLGFAGVLQITRALSDNDHLEELNLAENVDKDKHITLQHGSTVQGSPEVSQLNLDAFATSSTKLCSLEKADNNQQSSCVDASQHDIHSCNDLEVADSEDDEMKVEAAVSAFDGSCTSSCQRNSSSESQLVQELSIAIRNAKMLQLLDLSNNGFSAQDLEALYTCWSSGDRAGLGLRHIKDKTVHFSVEGNQCCRYKPCCRKD